MSNQLDWSLDKQTNRQTNKQTNFYLTFWDKHSLLWSSYNPSETPRHQENALRPRTLAPATEKRLKRTGAPHRKEREKELARPTEKREKKNWRAHSLARTHRKEREKIVVVSQTIHKLSLVSGHTLLLP